MTSRCRYSDVIIGTIKVVLLSLPWKKKKKKKKKKKRRRRRRTRRRRRRRGGGEEEGRRNRRRRRNTTKIRRSPSKPKSQFKGHPTVPLLINKINESWS